MLATFQIKIVQHPYLPLYLSKVKYSPTWKYFTLFKSSNSFLYARRFLQPASISFSFFPHPSQFLTLFEKHLHGSCTHCSSVRLIVSVNRGKITSLRSATALAAFAAAPPAVLRVWIVFIFHFDAQFLSRITGISGCSAYSVEMTCIPYSEMSVCIWLY